MSDPQEFAAFEHVLDRLLTLTNAERAHVRDLMAPSEVVPAHRKLVDQGRTYSSAFIVKSGWLIKYKLLPTGRRQILNFRLPGEVGGLDCLAYMTAPHSVSTLTECTVSRLSLETLEAMQRSQPRLATALFLLSYREEAILHEWEVSLGQRPAFARVAHLVLELYHRLSNRNLADEGAFRFPPTQQDIADSVGLTTPYVNRVMGELRADGLIQLTSRRLEILDMPRLVQVAGFGAGYLENWGRVAPSVRIGP